MLEQPVENEPARTALTELFDERYVRFWEPELGDERLDREQRLVVELGGLSPGDRVLDIACAYGRMTNALAGQGLAVTGLDISDPLLAEARRRADQLGITARFVHADMRELSSFSGFDCALLWFTCFGYFGHADNRRVLAETVRCLVPGGRLLLETRHWDSMHRRFDATTVRSRGDDLLIEFHSYRAETGEQDTRQILRVGNERIERTATLRRYGFPELRELCLDAGFRSVRGFDQNGAPLGPDSERCVLVAIK